MKKPKVKDKEIDLEEKVLLLEREKQISNLNAVFSKVLSHLEPPDDITVTEWAEKYRRLSSEASAETGIWRTSRTPYLREPMDAFTDPKVREIVMVAASQVGKSEFINNCIGYVIDEDPSSILFIQPTTIDAKEYSKLRIAPMIRDCPRLRRKVADPKSRDSSNTVLQKSYPGGILTLCGSTEAHALASKPIKVVLGDEIDRWKRSAGNEGDPWLLAKARQTTFYNAKSARVSTPTIKGESAIEKAYNKGTRERWNSKCPHCGEFHEIRWKDIRYDHETLVVDGNKTYIVKQVYYVCPGCGCVSDERTMKKAPSKWIAENPEAYNQGIRSFWLTAFVSAWVSWETIVLKYLNALGDPRELQVVYNTLLGELWEDRGDTVTEEQLLERREEYSADLPDGVLVLTCGVDTQDNRLEYEIVGYGLFNEQWGIKKGEIMGRPDDPAVWEALDEIIDGIYCFEDGLGLRISTTFVDEGGHFTYEVRQQCAKREHKKVFPIKGIGGPSVPYVSLPKKQKIVVDDIIVGYCWQYQIGTDAGKEIIMSNLDVQTPGARYCHFPNREDYDERYFMGLLSERKVYNAQKKQPWEWKKIPGHERNEPLDLRNYANAAFKLLPKNLDLITKRLQEARAKKTKGLATLSAPAKKPSKKKVSINKHYDDW